MYSIKTNKKTKNKFAFILVSICLIVVAAGIFMLALQDNDTDVTSINYDPPSNEEKNAGNEQKAEIAKQDKSANTTELTPSGKQKVTPIITSANQNSVSAYVPGIFEENGKCRALFSSGSESFSLESEGFGNVSYTQCAPFSLQVSDFPKKGQWNVVVSYSSGVAEGESQSQQIEVK